MRFYWLALSTLTVWRITHLLSAEDGPWKLVARWREWAGGGFWGELLDCFYCLSLWIAAPFAFGLGEDWKEKLMLWPALSGAGILLERLTAPPPAPFYEAPLSKPQENSDVLLRQEERRTSNERRTGD